MRARPLVIGALLAAAATSALAADASFTTTLRRQFGQDLIDYPTARFRDVRISSDKAGERVACGFVNSKNSLGGYTGWQQFIAIELPTGAVILIGSDAAKAKTVEGSCADPENKWMPGDFSARIAAKS